MLGASTTEGGRRISNRWGRGAASEWEGGATEGRSRASDERGLPQPRWSWSSTGVRMGVGLPREEEGRGVCTGCGRG